VYIDEAHAQDVWPISSARCLFDGQPVIVKAPQTNQQRCRLANQFSAQYDISPTTTVLVDAIPGNHFQKHYSCWPFRFYVLLKDSDGVVRVRLKAQPRGASYDLADVRDVLMMHCLI